VGNQILRLSATEAARDFSRLLDRIEAGGEAIIERHSRAVALIGPAATAPRRISECLAVPLARPSAAPDSEFAADLEEIIRGNPAVEFPSWE
jgi:antitoxin (DNA-binding transcriptional repressor) of toxin-antitoxin stability system